jgi:hypothetical protein
MAVTMRLGLRDVAGLAASVLAAYGRPPAVRASPVTGVLTFALCSVLAIVFGLAALACGGVALWIFAVPHLGAMGTALMIAGVLLLAGLAMAWTACAQLRSHARVPAPVPVPPSAEQLLAQGLQLFKEHKGAVLLAALVAGLVTGTTNRNS